MFYLIQSLIIGAVVVHNEYNHWTPNKILAALIGVGLAYLTTRILWALLPRRD
jgi:branched-subunit amino acid transport protein